MADARRIIFGSSVTPKETTTSEEGFTKTSILTQDSNNREVKKRFGSKGNVEITDAQWGDGWTSMFHSHLLWENIDLAWEVPVDYWDGTVAISSTGIRLGPNNSTVVKFVYVKNVGDNAAQMSLNGGSNYDIIIPAGGSVSFRGTSNLTMQNVKVQRVSADTEIEYIIAK